MTAHPPLTRAQMEILEFERAVWPRFAAGRRDATILERFGHSPTRHAQLVLHIIKLPAAAAYDPQLVARLTRIRDGRLSSRAKGFEIGR